MGEMFIRKLTEADEVWLCDNCANEGVRANGKEIVGTGNLSILWFCYNCIQEKSIK